MSGSPPTSHAVPQLETARLMLRAHQREDLPAYAAMWGDPEVVRYIGGKASTTEESWWRILGHLGHWAIMGYGYWALVERASGRLVGEAGFGNFKRDSDPSFQGLPEAGWVLAPWAHGAGFATEAAGAVVAWGDRHLPRDHSFCLIDPDHGASIRVAQKLGYQATGMTTYKGDACILFRRNRPERIGPAS